MRAYRFAWRPGWLLFHAFTVAAVVTMILLGRWQLTVSEHKHFSLQNFGYALQWWAFSVFAVIMWARILRDQGRRAAALGDPLPARPVTMPAGAATRSAPEPVAYRRYVPPPVDTTADDDPVYAAYNDYLAKLNQQH